MKNHDLLNPRIKKYSNLKILLRNFEFVIKNIIYIFFLIVNLIYNSKKNKYIDLNDYEDTRYINFLIYSLKKKFGFSYNLNFQVLRLIKKIGIKNFLNHCAPNFRVKNIIKKRALFNTSKKTNECINFDTNYFKYVYNSTNSKDIIMPYYLYPRTYNNNYKKADDLKNNLKKIKIFFSGSVNEEVYSNFNWKDINGKKMLNRVEIIDFIINNFKEKIFFINSIEDLKKGIESKKEIFLSINDRLIKKTKTNLSNLDHLYLISISNFFITAPGADMPLCHHLIESIKMKTIPITSYNEFMIPSLSPQNYLNFSGYDDLKHCINSALNMNEEKKINIQNNLNVFYENFLSPASFCKKFELNNYNNIIACNDIESVERFYSK